MPKFYGPHLNTVRRVSVKCLSMINSLLLILLITAYAVNISAQTTLSVVDAGGAIPSSVIGNYTENGTLNGKPAYQGPNGYWIYFAHSSTFSADFWFVGTPEGNANLNGTTGFYYQSSASTPPMNVNYNPDQNSAGYIQIQSGGSASPPPAVTMASSSSSDVTATSITVYWTASSQETGYKLDVATDSLFTSFVYKAIDITGSPYPPTTYNVTGLNAGTTYYFRVRAYNGAGESANSNYYWATTNPPKPVSTASSNVKSTSFQANWDSTAGASYYNVYVSSKQDFSAPLASYNPATSSADSLSVTGLSPDSTYYYKVQGVNQWGQSGFSGVISVTTAPQAPVETQATSVTGNSFIANWNAAPGALGYEIDVATDSGFINFVQGWNNKKVGDTTSYSVNINILPGTTYYIRVRSGNANGISDYSNIISVTTLNAPPVLSGIETAPLYYGQNGSPESVSDSIKVFYGQNLIDSAIVRITNNYNMGEDSLSFVNTANISGDWNKNSGEIILTGQDSASNYQKAIMSVEYQNTNSHPDTTTRSLSFVVYGGSDASDTLTRRIDMQTLNLTSSLKGVSLTAGNKFAITWVSSNIENIKIEFSADSGLTWTPIVNSESAASGKYDWTIPDISTVLAKIRISDSADANINSVSRGVFNISYISGTKEAASNFPKVFSLNQNYPNPFNPSTNISFTLPKESRVILKIYNILGQEVATLVNRDLSAGRYTYRFNALNLTSGVYIYRLRAGNIVFTKDMMLLK